MTLQIEVVSPEKVLWSGEGDMVIARTVGGGDIAFLTGHAPFVGALEIAKVTVRPPSGPDELIAVHGGFVEISGDKVTILSDVAELADQIDVARAQRARDAAEAAVRSDESDEDAADALKRANVRLDTAGATTTA